MNSVLQRRAIILNKVWQVIGEKDVQQCLIDLAGGNYTALDIDGDKMVPVKWDDWINLKPLNDEEVIRTPHRLVRMPTVLIACNFDKVPKRRPKFTLANIAKRDGYRCAYTGKNLPRDRWSLDHVVPRSRGGKDSPDNVVLADKDVNNRKGNKLPQEAGLPVPTVKKLHSSMPVASHPHHQLFLKQ